jgi:hypothetical protein
MSELEAIILKELRELREKVDLLSDQLSDNKNGISVDPNQYTPTHSRLAMPSMGHPLDNLSAADSIKKMVEERIQEAKMRAQVKREND